MEGNTQDYVLNGSGIPRRKVQGKARMACSQVGRGWASCAGQGPRVLPVTTRGRARSGDPARSLGSPSFWRGPTPPPRKEILLGLPACLSLSRAWLGAA